MVAISLMYFGHTQNMVHKVLNICLCVLGVLFIFLDFLIAGDLEEKKKVEETNDGIYNEGKPESQDPNKNRQVTSESQLDKVEDAGNNPYEIPQDF